MPIDVLRRFFASKTDGLSLTRLVIVGYSWVLREPVEQEVTRGVLGPTRDGSMRARGRAALESEEEKWVDDGVLI